MVDINILPNIGGRTSTKLPRKPPNMAEPPRNSFAPPPMDMDDFGSRTMEEQQAEPSSPRSYAWLVIVLFIVIVILIAVITYLVMQRNCVKPVGAIAPVIPPMMRQYMQMPSSPQMPQPPVSPPKPPKDDAKLKEAEMFLAKVTAKQQQPEQPTNSAELEPIAEDPDAELDTEKASIIPEKKSLESMLFQQYSSNISD